MPDPPLDEPIPATAASRNPDEPPGSGDQLDPDEIVVVPPRCSLRDHDRVVHPFTVGATDCLLSVPGLLPRYGNRLRKLIGIDSTLDMVMQVIDLQQGDVPMDLSSFTTRSQQALNSAASAAVAAGNPSVEPAHLLAALLTQTGGTAAPCSRRPGWMSRTRSPRPRAWSTPCPSASGATVQTPGLSRAALQVLQRGQDLATQLGDDFVSSEHLVVALATVQSPVSEMLERLGATPDALQAAFASVRGTARVTSQDAEDTLPVAGEVRRRPDGRGSRGQARPGHRARQRDPPSRPGAEPPHQEQPRADRGARRGQDRRRRGSGPTHRRGRRPRVAAGAGDSSRSTWRPWSPEPSTAASSRNGSRLC